MPIIKIKGIIMTANFVLIKTKPGKECEVYDILQEVPEIVETHQLFGEYDLIVKVEATSTEKVSQIVVDRIRYIKGIIDTKTLLGLKW
jgi:DNA-binding Lrp family transcriptional regulator